MKHLAFQLFTAGPGFDTEGGVTRTIQKTRPWLGLIERRARDIVERIGDVPIAPDRALAIVVGPLCLDHTEEQMAEIVDHGFETAAELGVSIGFHIDDSKFCFRRSDLWNMPECIETSDWEGTLNTGQFLNWGEAWKLAPQLCFNAQPVIDAARQMAATVGHRIATHLDRMPEGEAAMDFAGVIAGWETSIGPDADTGKALGYRALSNRGYSRSNPPESMEDELMLATREWIDVWAKNLVDSGIPRERVYSHVVPGYVPFETSLIEHGRPGFTMYNGTVAQQQVFQIIEATGHTGGWALAEGADVNIEAPIWRPGDDPEKYLEDLFEHGASLVNLFGWGVGSPTNPFRRAVESDEAIAAYRNWLRGGGREPPAS